MSRFESKVIVAVRNYNQGEPDKNGKTPVILLVQAGKAPNRIVQSGTVAENAGFEVGKTYLAQCREIEPDEQYGRQFTWTALKEADMSEILSAEKLLGKPQVFDAAEEGSSSTAEAVTATQSRQVPANDEVN